MGIEKIDAAIDAFASAIKYRMHEKHEAGYTGWDGEYPITELINELIDDAMDIKENIPIKKLKATCTNISLNRATDIGARAMMLWYRHIKGGK